MPETLSNETPLDLRDRFVGAGVGALFNLHSFPALAIAISVGPFQGPLSARQLWFGYIMAFTGAIIAAFQIRLGRLFIASARGEDRVEAKQVLRVIFMDLPVALLCFWLAIWLWLLAKWA